MQGLNLARDPFINRRPVLRAAAFLWLLAGGLFYTGGIVFFALDSRYPWMHGVWHLFVLAGSICHYVAILVYV